MNVRHWLPATQQMSDAAQLRPDVYVSTTMRQALGLIVFLGLMAGAIPFVFNWVVGARAGAALPLAQLAGAAEEMVRVAPGVMVGTPVFVPDLRALADLFQTVAGLDQPLSGWQAAGLSALGEWLNWPLLWLNRWLVYGLLVMAAAKLLGATNTLQPFYAATGYAAVPLVLTGLVPIPCVGPILAFLGSLWSLAVYVRGVQAATGFTILRSILAVVLPAATLALVGLIAFGLAVFTALVVAL
jgi:hypothetical protein